MVQPRVLVVVLAGGEGGRLELLTDDRAKPAVPFGGKFRIIDFPLSNCINSGGEFQFAIPTASDINNKYADFKVVIMEGVGHYPMLEKPAEFNEKLREVLKEFGH